MAWKMTLKQLINRIGQMAIDQKIINYSAAGGSIAQINPISVEWYALLFITPSGSHDIDDATTTYTLTLTFIDRLLEDNSNDIDIYSSSIEGLKNIILGIRMIDGVLDVQTSYQIQNFTDTESLNDRVSGSYATIRVVTSNEDCFVE